MGPQFSKDARLPGGAFRAGGQRVVLIACLALLASSALPQPTLTALRSRLLEQQALSPNEIDRYDTNHDGVVDVADLRWLVVTPEEIAACEASVRGRLIDDAAGTLIRDASITVRQFGIPLETQAGHLGSYRFEDLVAGDFEIEVVEPSGLYLTARVPVTLECGDNVADVRLTRIRSLVLEAKDWYDRYRAGEGAEFPPEPLLQNLVLVLYGTDWPQGYADPLLDTLYADAYGAVVPLVTEAFHVGLPAGSLRPIGEATRAYAAHLELRDRIDPAHFASLRYEARYLYQRSLYLDLIDNLLSLPEWHEAWLIGSVTFTDGLTQTWRPRTLASLIAQHYAPRGRLGPTGMALLQQLYQDVPADYEHWDAFSPQVALLELLGAELGPEARALLALAWAHYRAGAPETGPGSREELDERGLDAAMDQIDAAKDLENEDYLEWFEDGNLIDPPPEQTDVLAFLQSLEPVSSESAPWDAYVAYLGSIEDFMTSPVPLLPGPPQSDTLAIQLIFDAYRWVRSATPGDEGGDLNQNGLKTAVREFARLYVRAFGATVDSRDVFGEDALPGVDTVYGQRDTLFSASPELWDSWRDSYAGSREANLEALWGLVPAGPGTLVTSSHLLSPSRWNDSALELNAFQQRFAQFAMAHYLYAYAALEHRKLLFDARSRPLGPGLPPDPTGRMRELVRWYAAALTLATKAHHGDNWTAGGLAVPDVRLYAFLQNETETLLARLVQALELATQGLDPWGLLKRPFSTVEPDRLREILQSTIAKWDDWRRQDRDTALLDFEVERTARLGDAARFDVLAAEYARDAAAQKLEQARALRNIQALRVQLADMQVERAGFHQAAADLYAKAQAGQLTAQELRHEIAANKHEMLQRQVEVLGEQLDAVHKSISQSLETAIPILRDANATLTQFVTEYDAAFRAEKKRRPWWQKLTDTMKSVVGGISEALTGINLWERIEDEIDFVGALVTGDFDTSLELLGKMTKENINSPIFKKAVQEKFKMSDEQVDALADGATEFIDNILPEDPEQMRQDLIDQFLFSADDPPALANDLMSNLFAERLLDMGMSYALATDELALFAGGYGLTVDRAKLDLLAQVLRVQVGNALKTRFPADAAAIDAAIADLASATEIVSIASTLERRLFRSVVARDADPNEVVLAFLEQRKPLLLRLSDGLGDLAGWDARKAEGFGEAWSAFVKRRSMAVVDREARSARTISKQDLMALLPQETLDSLNTTGIELRKAKAHVDYLNDQSGHLGRMQQNAVWYADPDTEDQAVANRDAHILEFRENLEGLALSLNTAQTEAVKVQNELIRIRQGAYEQQMASLVEEKLVGVEQDLAGAKQAELEVAATSLAMAETEREVAARQLEVADLVIAEQMAVLAGLEQEVLAQQARAAAAEAEEARALSEEAFHAGANALDLDRAWVWRRMARDTAQEIVFRGMFDFARTVDLLRGTSLLDTLRALDVQDVEQAKVGLEIFDLMLFKKEVAQVYNIILSEEDTTPGVVVASVALGAQAPPEAGLVVGTYDDAQILNARDGTEWLVWQLELLDGEGTLPEHFHPGLRDGAARDYNQLPPAVTAAFRRVRVPVTGAGERKVFRALSVQPRIDGAPGPFNTDLHLVHLGDMWLNDQARPTADIAVQWAAVAPVEFAPGGEYRLPASHTAFDIDFTNNQLYVALRPDPDPNAREFASSGDYGANYPVLGTWWVMGQRSYFQADVHLRITFYARSVFRLQQETQSAFQHAMDARDKQVFEAEITAAARALRAAQVETADAVGVSAP